MGLNLDDNKRPYFKQLNLDETFDEIQNAFNDLENSITPSSLDAVLAAGNETGGNNIVMSYGDRITDTTGNAFMTLTGFGFPVNPGFFAAVNGTLSGGFISIDPEGNNAMMLGMNDASSPFISGRILVTTERALISAGIDKDQSSVETKVNQIISIVRDYTNETSSRVVQTKDYVVFNRNFAGPITETLRIKLDTNTINLPNLPTYANNADAISGGLVTSDVYKTSTGELRIVI